MNAPQPGPNRYMPVDQDVLDRRLEAADKPGQHLWILTAAWLSTAPELAHDPGAVQLLDQENLIGFAGPGCWKCEEPWGPQIARRKCRGSLE